MSWPKQRTLYNPLNRQRWCYSDRIVSSYSPLFKLIVRHRTGIRPDCLNQSLHGLLMHIVSHGPLCKQGEINFIHVAVLYFVFVLMCQIIVEIKKLTENWNHVIYIISCLCTILQLLKMHIVMFLFLQNCEIHATNFCLYSVDIRIVSLSQKSIVWKRRLLVLTDWGRVTHICVGNLWHHWFR